MMTKRILFYVFAALAAVFIISVINLTSALLSLICLIGMWKITHNMSVDEINSLLGAEWLNKKFNTKHFTEEEQNMKRFFTSVLNAHFKNCLYGNSFIQKLAELINNEYPIKEIFNNGSDIRINIDNTCIVELKLSPAGYIRTIDVMEA